MCLICPMIAASLLLGFLVGCESRAVPTTPSNSTTKPIKENIAQTTASNASVKDSAAPGDHPIPAELATEELPSDGLGEPIAAEVNEEPFVVEEGFMPLSLIDFDAFAADAETWTEADGIVVCTGKPRGYLRSKAGHRNFTWRLEYRFDRPKSLKDEAKFKGNTGFLVYVNGEDKLWPVCLEVQGKHVQMGAVKENGGAAPISVEDDEAARQSARQGVGRWNRLEIVSRDGALKVNLNETPISRSEPNFLSEGAIGIQAEDHPFQVRRMRIRDE